MIDEKKLIEDIKNLIDSEELAGHSPGSVLHSVCEKVWEQPKACEWIPVSERLPENFTSVLLTAKMPEDVECLVYTGGRAGTDFTLDGVINSERYEVIAWQPLPEPYREESAE